jgi:hypothetical protein
LKIKINYPELTMKNVFNLRGHFTILGMNPHQGLYLEGSFQENYEKSFPCAGHLDPSDAP